MSATYVTNCLCDIEIATNISNVEHLIDDYPLVTSQANTMEMICKFSI